MNDPFANLLTPSGFQSGAPAFHPITGAPTVKAASTTAAPAQAAPAAAPAAQPAAVNPYGPGGAMFGQVQSYNTGLNAINQTSQGSFGSLYNNLMGSADAIAANDKSQQLGIDQSRENNQLNRMNGIQDILSYVRSGLQSGGAQLANMNAGDSSATGALARAYSMLGNQQSRDVNNQSALTDRGIDTQQQQLGIQNQSSTTQLQRYRDSQVQNIATDLSQRLAALDQQAANASLPDRVNIDQQKQQLLDAGNAQVGQVDTYLQGLLGGISPEGQDQVLGNANQLRTAGAAATNPFNVNLPQGGLQPLQGPALDQLPILVNPAKSKQTS